MKRFLISICVVIFLGLVLVSGYVLRYPCDQKPYPKILSFALSYRCGATAPAPEPAAQGTLPAPATGTGGTVPPQGNAPSAGNNSSPAFAALAMVFEKPVAAFFARGDGNVAVIETDGKIATINSGRTTPVSESVIQDLAGASFSVDGSRILALFGSRVNLSVSIFDMDAKTWHPLPQGIRSPAWAWTGSKIAYLSPSAGGAWNLTTLDAGNAKMKPQSVLQLHIEDANLLWPSSDRILLFGKANALVPASLMSILPAKKTVTPILQDMRGLSFLWGEKAGRVLAFESNVSRRGGTLRLFDVGGVPVRTLDIGTLPAKCIFDEGAATSTQTAGRLICAVPNDQEKFARTRLPDDYAMKSYFTADSFYAINLSDGSIETLFGGTGAPVDATLLQRTGSKLFFVNRLDGKLYALTLTE